MPSIDWTSGEALSASHRLRFLMVAPNDLDSTLGELDGVDLSRSSISEGYYTDTRQTARITVVDGNWVRQSLIRVIHEMPELGFREELGTFLVTGDDATRENGATVIELECKSMLYALSTRYDPHPWTIAAGASATKCMEDLFSYNARPYLFVGAHGHVYGSTLVLETGKSELERLYALAGDSDNRLDVDGHGRVIVSAYTRPAERASTFEIRFDEKGLSEGAISRTSDYLQTPTECHVVWQHTETEGEESVQQELYGTAINDGRTGLAERGYVVSDLKIVSDLDPPTVRHAEELARERLSRLSVEDVSWELSCAYMPIHEGDVGTLVGLVDGYGYGGDHKAFVKSLELSLSDMTLSLTLKSTGSLDTETKGDD